jgi:hypothetical protein
MRNVLYHFANNIAVNIRSLQGQLVPKGDLPVFDDKQSFTLDISSAEIAMSPDNLANVLNSYSPSLSRGTNSRSKASCIAKVTFPSRPKVHSHPRVTARSAFIPRRSRPCICLPRA